MDASPSTPRWNGLAQAIFVDRGRVQMSSPQKQVRIILMFAFMASVVIHGVLVIILSRQPATPPAIFLENARGICYTFAAAGLLTSVYWTLVKLTATVEPARFQTEMIVALTLAEICSVAGLFVFFLGRNPADFWPFGIATLVVQGVFILPRVLQRD
jgi:hypothetical protein